jgi:hypothetical protein
LSKGACGENGLSGCREKMNCSTCEVLRENERLKAENEELNSSWRRPRRGESSSSSRSSNWGAEGHEALEGGPRASPSSVLSNDGLGRGRRAHEGKAGGAGHRLGRR